MANRVNEQTILQDLGNQDDTDADLRSLDVDDWIENHGFTLSSARALIASAAKEYSWFENHDALAGSTLIARIDQLYGDIYGAESKPPPEQEP